MSVARKRVSWVELYLDLIFVLAVGRLAHEIVLEPRMRSVWIALGLFLTLWWTWIGFAVLSNRHGDDDRRQRLLFLAGSVPAGLAAVAIEPAAEGHSAALALSLAATRVVLALAHAVEDDWRDGLRRRVSRAYVTSAVLFALSAAVPGPWRYVLWAVAIGVESGAVLAQTPSSDDEALDSHHFAERFGLFLIILLGEVVISAGNSSLAGEEDVAGVWAALVAAMILAAALWWLYFDAAAELNLRVLELSGGSPAIARAIFAGGHMLPAFGADPHRVRAGAAAGGPRPAARRLLAPLRRDRALPRGHARVPVRGEPGRRGAPGRPARRDLPARLAGRRALGPRVRLAADGLDGDVRRAGLAGVAVDRPGVAGVEAQYQRIRGWGRTRVSSRPAG